MRILFLFILVHWANAVSPVFDPYLTNSKLCAPWSCINSELGFNSSRPGRDHYANVLRSVLPDTWQDVVFDVVSECYAEELPRRYTNTCEGQAMLHCVVENLIKYCPEGSLRKKDACAPLSSLAGFKYMFSQSRYNNLEENLPFERRPPFFLKNYFSSKCCDLPELFPGGVLRRCGFQDMVQYYNHAAKPVMPSAEKLVVATPVPVTTPRPVEAVRVAEMPDLPDEVDPLDCCDMEGFLSSSARAECGFTTTRGLRGDLLREAGAPAAVTSTAAPKAAVRYHDVKIVPHSCDKSTCVFSQLDLLSPDGTVDRRGFARLLDNLTSTRPEWVRAKALVISKCLSRPLAEYEADCEINRVLGCTFDVLSENCPHAKKKSEDPCKRATPARNDTICQVSSSKYGPKRRRQYCDFPRLVSAAPLRACAVWSVSRMQSAPAVRAPAWASPMCKEASVSANCVLSKMDVLNKYRFMDYFKMKDRLKQFTDHNPEWAVFSHLYTGRMLETRMYREYCSSPRRLLNVLDAMLSTCPISRRKTTEKCKKMFDEIKNMQNNTKSVNYEDLLEKFKKNPHTYIQHGRPLSHHQEPILQKPDANFEENLPPVRVMEIAPQVMSIKPKKSGILIRKPVYVSMIPPPPLKNMADLPPKSPLSVLPPFPKPFDINSLLRSGQTGLPKDTRS